ncbi:MAG: S-layer homology domain-containing protein, partial [Desulfurispora sp.]|uniref:S-layer homology domain-containing protein n=1 Tax=Desulfurispora sp. TaxID=3014275 RepID=UPI0040495940
MLVLLCALVFLFSLTTCAWAAYKDVNGTPYEDAVNALTALGIVKGYDDGTIQPDKTITRAEFATILAREIGIGQQVGQAPTTFSDVPASHWASGYIALAVGKGWIKGYGDGTFKPENNVTYAEAVTMVVRLLGYGPFMDESKWPTPYIAKAAQIGVTKGVRGDAYAPAKRGDVFLMAYNALDADTMTQEKWGSETIFTESDKFKDTILHKYLKIDRIGDKTYKARVVATPLLDENHNLNKNEIKIAFENTSDKNPYLSDAGTYKLLLPIDPNTLWGLEVELWVNDDDEVVFVKNHTEKSKIVTDVIDEEVLDSNNKIVKLKTWRGDKEYEFARDENGSVITRAFLLGEKWNADAKATTARMGLAQLLGYKVPFSEFRGTSVKMVLDDNDKILYLDGRRGNAVVVQSVDTEKERIKYYYKDEGTKTWDLSDNDKFIVIRDGKLASLADIKPGDVVRTYPNPIDQSALGVDEDDIRIIDAFSMKIEGVVQDVEIHDNNWPQDCWLTIGTTKVPVYGDVTENKWFLPGVTTISYDNNETIEELPSFALSNANNNDYLRDLIGYKVTAYIGVLQIRHIVVDKESGPPKDKVAVLQKNAKWIDDAEQIKLVAVNESGKEVTWQFDADDVEVTMSNGTKYNDNNTPSGGWRSFWEINFQLTSSNKLLTFEYTLKGDGSLKSIKVLSPTQYTDDGNARDEFDEDDNTVSVNGAIYNVSTNTIIFDTTDTDVSDGKLNDISVKSWDDVKENSKLTKLAYVVKQKAVDLKYLFITETSGGNLTSDGQYAIVKGFTTVNGDDAVKLLTPEGKEIVVV